MLKNHSISLCRLKRALYGLKLNKHPKGAIAVHYRSFLLTIPYLICHEIMKRARSIQFQYLYGGKKIEVE